MPQLVVQGRAYQWPDPATITFRESKLIKDKFGLSMMGLFQSLASGSLSEDVLLGMFAIAKTRADGDIDIDKALDLSLSDIQIEDDPADEEPEPFPLDDNGDATGEPKPRRKSASSSVS